MSNIDKRALREAAEKATSGKWERGDGNGNGGELLVYCDDALGSAVCEMTSEYNAIPKYQRINNLNFIAAANPATVLALLDELEAKEKRIAELEAREVVLPQRYSMLHRVDFDEPYHTEMVYKQHQVLEALHDAGVKVAAAAGKGD
ncbi:ead/Ea22-like family protein [Enterobacter hormaechei]